MARQKLRKFEENKSLDNIIEPGKAFFNEVKGNWKSNIFKNEKELVLEIACGRGEYTTGLASQYPTRNFVGIDIKGDRIWYGANLAKKNNLVNVAFLRSKVHDLEKFFCENEVDEIWIVHPDPRPKTKDERRRLTNQRFLDLYKKISRKNAWIRLKTDNRKLFDYTLKLLEKNKVKELDYTFNLDKSPLLREHFEIETRYEHKFKALGFPINYLKFKFDD